MSIVRTRFAPSPTGYLHVGGVRTALFAWLIAKQSKGVFVLRIEDTDKVREVEGSASHIIACLNWLNITPDEGVGVSDDSQNYYQSNRLAIYKKWATILIEKGHAYVDPYTPEQVQQFREQAQREKRPFLFRHHRPETVEVWDGTKPLRFKSSPKAYAWRDEVMGEIKTGPEVVDDFILIKSDGYPTYNFAHIIDDYEMEITHVIRGQEFLASMPNFLNLYDALEFDRPTFATVPPIMNEQGNKKLSKRDGAKDILAYREDGYLPDAMRNFLASLGWNDGTEQEVFTTKELIEKFQLSRVQKSGARFDENRLLWLNGAHIRMLSLDTLYAAVSPINDDPISGTGFWPASAYTHSADYRRTVLALAQDRLKLFEDLRQFNYFFETPTVDETLITSNKQLKKLTAAETELLLSATIETLGSIDSWKSESIQSALNALLETTGQKPGILFSLIRIITTWAPFSPALPETLEVLGKEAVMTRLKSYTKSA